MRKFIFAVLTAISTAAAATNVQFPFEKMSAQDSLTEVFSADDGSKWFIELRVFAIVQDERSTALVATFHRVPGNIDSPLSIGVSTDACSAGGGMAIVRRQGETQGARIQWKRSDTATKLIDALVSITCIVYDEYLKANQQQPSKPSSPGSNRGMML